MVRNLINVEVSKLDEPFFGKKDNLLFSCCCAHIDWTWTEVCDCHRGGWNCDLDCLQEALVEESLFYPIGTVSPLNPFLLGLLGE